MVVRRDVLFDVRVGPTASRPCAPCGDEAHAQLLDVDGTLGT